MHFQLNYLNSYKNKSFEPSRGPTLAFNFENFKNQDLKYQIYDTCSWGGPRTSRAIDRLSFSDGVILLFDISDEYNSQKTMCLRAFMDFFSYLCRKH